MIALPVKIGAPKIGNYVIAFLTILALNFLLPRMMPSDPLTAICGEEVFVEMTPGTENRTHAPFCFG